MKSWYLSKTIWFNAIAAIAILLQTRYGFVIDLEAQSGILAVVNLILRVITKGPIEWAQTNASAQGGFIRLPLLLIVSLLICASLLIAGCSTTRTVSPVPAATDSPMVLAGKSLLAVKSTIVVAATSTDALCKAGKIPAETCAQAKAAYELAQPAYDAAVDSYLLMSSEGGDSGAFGRALSRVQTIAANMLQLAGGVH